MTVKYYDEDGDEWQYKDTSINPTVFPDWESIGDYGEEAYYKDDVEDWFKRCIEDYPRPNEDKTAGGYIAKSTFCDIWFDKWFSQFRNQSKNVSDMIKQSETLTINDVYVGDKPLDVCRFIECRFEAFFKDHPYYIPIDDDPLPRTKKGKFRGMKETVMSLRVILCKFIRALFGWYYMLDCEQYE